MKKLVIGNFEIGEINRSFSSYKEFLDWLDSLGDGFREANYKEWKFIMNLKQFGILAGILSQYCVKLVTSIGVQVEDDFGFKIYGIEVLIEDPIEIEKFINGNDAIGFNSDGYGIGCRKGNSNIMDWSEEAAELFISRTI